MNLLQQWLDSERDYEAGRLLYEQYGLNAFLKRTLSHGPTAYNVSCVREEIEKLAKKVHDGGAPYPVGLVGNVLAFSSLNQPAPAAPAAAVVENVIAAQPAPGLAPEVEQLLLELDKEWKPLYKDAAHLQAQLKNAPDVQTRCQYAFKILDLTDQVEAIWEKQAHVREHGQLPAAPVVAPPPALDLTDQAAVQKRRNSLRVQISKQKDKPERAADVAAWKTEVEQLNEVLKTFNSST